VLTQLDLAARFVEVRTEIFGASRIMASHAVDHRRRIVGP
jgi:hypothetical protein